VKHPETKCYKEFEIKTRKSGLSI